MKTLYLSLMLTALVAQKLPAQPFKIVDTGQKTCYEDLGLFPPSPSGAAHCPGKRQAFYGQDGQYAGASPAYRFRTAVAADSLRLVDDLNTGLTWMAALAAAGDNAEAPLRFTFREAQACVARLNQERYGGFDDWRIPGIKELYSLILFTGSSATRPPHPYLDTQFFDYQLSDNGPVAGAPEPAGLRPIDGQFWSSTLYAGKISEVMPAAFGVNFADGRIKAYPIKDPGHSGRPAAHFLRCVRGEPYGINRFTEHGDGTITDAASGLMWTKYDSHHTALFDVESPVMDWETALRAAEALEYAGYTDWRLPNAKELQSIVDYTRAPNAADPAYQGPAIDPLFSMPDSSAWYWSGTTHLEDRGGRGAFAVTVCFGPATCIGRSGELVDFHGAGAQRSSPKSQRVTRPDWQKQGLGPQRDEVRLHNYIRCVRNR